MRGICSECGTETNLDPDARVCTWRAGCEHRQMQHRVQMERLNAQLAWHDPLPCGHTTAEHHQMALAASRRRHPSSDVPNQEDP